MTAPSDLDIYNVYRDYIKHEDSLLGSRLSSFLTMNSFMIGASVIILGSMIGALSRLKLDSDRLLILVCLGTVIHTILAVTGRESAKLTATSIQAATDALAKLRDHGNERLEAGIARKDFPPVTNARLLTDAEKGLLDTGTGIMRGIPLQMATIWLLIGIMPFLMLVLVVMARAGIVSPLP